jgi:hypothetical protein
MAVEVSTGRASAGKIGISRYRRKTVTRYGFSGFHRFVMEYWRVYGKMPPIRPLDPTDK